MPRLTEEQLINKYKEMSIYENEAKDKGYKYIAGIDEVGRGPLAGPVVAACVILPDDEMILGLDDSKKVSAKKREMLSEQIKEKAIWSIGMVSHEDIDKFNIKVATFLYKFSC